MLEIDSWADWLLADQDRKASYVAALRRRLEFALE